MSIKNTASQKRMLKTVGRVLYGNSWKTPMAKAMGYSQPSAISLFFEDRLKIPTDLSLFLTLLRHKRSEITEVIESLENFNRHEKIDDDEKLNKLVWIVEKDILLLNVSFDTREQVITWLNNKQIDENKISIKQMPFYHFKGLLKIAEYSKSRNVTSFKNLVLNHSKSDFILKNLAMAEEEFLQEEYLDHIYNSLLKNQEVSAYFNFINSRVLHLNAYLTSKGFVS